MVQISTSISTVTVYPDRARVLRSGSAHPNADEIQPGQYTFEIVELPLALNPDSVRAAARGTARVHLLGLQVQRAFYAQTPAEGARQLEAQIEVLEDELNGFDARSELVKKSQSALDALAGRAQVYAAALASGEMTLEKQMALFDGMRQKAEKLSAELLEIESRKREMKRLVQKLSSELEQQRSSRPSERYTALVEVEVLQAGALAVELSYVVAGAGWKPLYDLRLLEGEDLKPSLELSYLAQVSQRSGEPWNEASLTLSTARPALASTLPELDPWYIAPLQIMPAPAAVAFLVVLECLLHKLTELRACLPGPVAIGGDEFGSDPHGELPLGGSRGGFPRWPPASCDDSGQVK
jgi:uncharacterized protein (TIGR02231 family)